MPWTNLGEFEELVLLTIAAPVEVYSVAVCGELANYARSLVNFDAGRIVHHHLEEEVVESQLVEAGTLHGGKRKKFYQSPIQEKERWYQPIRSSIDCGTRLHLWF